MGHYENGRNGGKLPLYIREAFHDAVERFLHWHFYAAPRCPEPTVWLDDEHGEIALTRVFGLVWNCINILPMDINIRIDLTAGERTQGLTYACGARRLLCLINWQKGLKGVRGRGAPKSMDTVTGERELKAQEAMLALKELFSNLPHSDNINHHKYMLEFEDGQPVFRRDEICLTVEKAINDVCGPGPENDGDDIVPQKLAKHFPGSFKTPRC